MKDRLRRALLALRLGAVLAFWRRLRSWDPRLVRRRASFRRFNRGARPDEMVVRPGLRLTVDPRSREPFEWFCWRSVEMARELDGFVREMRARQRFLDVGACHGIFSLVFVQGRPAARAVAVEPSAIAYAILAENVRLGGLANVAARQVACGAGPGTLRMRQTWHHLEALPAERPGDGAPGAARDRAGDPPGGLGETASGAMGAGAGRAAQDTGGGNRGAEANGGAVDGEDGEDSVVVVPMRTVDDLCADLDFAPDLVKIDVEGFEQAVLAGARATLARCRPPLFLELHPQRLAELGGSVEQVLDLLAGLGYRFQNLDGSPLGRRHLAARQSVSRIRCAVAP